MRWPSAVASAVLLAGLASADAAPRDASRPAPWLTTWATAPHFTLDPIGGRSVRIVARTSAGGRRIRVRLSNAAGGSPLRVQSATVARRATGARLATAPVPLRVGGRSAFTVAPGRDVLTDPVAFAVPERSDLAVSLHVGSPSPRTTAHFFGLETSYIAPAAAGDVTRSVSGQAYTEEMTTSVLVTEVQVPRAVRPGTVVAFGSSSVDGEGTTVGGHDRWLDVLDARLARRPACERFSVANAGVAGDTFEGWLARVPRDVLRRPSLRTVILYAGSNNDIFGQGDSAQEAIAQLVRVIVAIRRGTPRGVRLIGVTSIPRERFALPGQEPERQAFNAWMRRSPRFDAVLDFDRIVRDPRRPARYRPGLTDDGFHANPRGNLLQGRSIPLGILGGGRACWTTRTTAAVVTVRNGLRSYHV